MRTAKDERELRICVGLKALPQLLCQIWGNLEKQVRLAVVGGLRIVADRWRRGAAHIRGHHHTCVTANGPSGASSVCTYTTAPLRWRPVAKVYGRCPYVLWVVSFHTAITPYSLVCQ
jgi:hypothetical protein